MKTPDKNTIDKVLDGVATKQQAKEVVKWFSSTAEGQSYLSSLINRDIQRMESGDLLSSGTSFTHSQRIYEEIMQKIAVRKTRRLWMRVAAILIPFLLIAALTNRLHQQVDLFGGSTYTEIYVPKGKQQQVFFQDGSEVFLNAETTLRFPTKFGLRNRKVYLEGEGYFNVKSNRRRPFIVDLEKSNVTVLGTSFNVKSYKEDKDLTIVLDKGKVAFNTQLDSYELKPRQKAVYDKTTGKCTISDVEKSSKESIWRYNYIRFMDTPLAEVINVLTRKFNVSFNILDAEALNYTYTITTNQSSIQELISELEKISPVKFEIQNDTTINIYLK